MVSPIKSNLLKIPFLGNETANIAVHERFTADSEQHETHRLRDAQQTEREIII
jgi:hypothetical protein